MITKNQDAEMEKQYSIELLAKRIMGHVQWYGPQWKEVRDPMEAKDKIEDALKAHLQVSETRRKAAERVVEAARSHYFGNGPTAPIIRAIREYDKTVNNE